LTHTVLSGILPTMATLTLRVSDYEKQAIKELAIAEGKSMKSLLLEAVGVKKRGTIHKAMQDIEQGNVYSFESFDDLCEAIRSW